MMSFLKRLISRAKSDRRLTNAVNIGPRASETVMESVEARQLFAAGLPLGININEASSTMTKLAIPQLKSLGVKSVRIWLNPGSFTSRKLPPVMQKAIMYKNAGFDVMCEVVAPNGSITSPSQVKSWFQWAVKNPGWKNAVDRWQIGNEPDHAAYWRGSMSQYVNLFLKPASEALRAVGEKVVSAGPSWNPQDVKKMIDAGMLNYADYVGFHPYANSVTLAKQRVAELKAVVNGRKPLVASEWNIRGLEGNKTAWAKAVASAVPTMKGNFAFNYYFGLVQKTSTKAGPGGVLTTGGARTQFYSAISSGSAQRSESVVLRTVSGKTSIVTSTATTFGTRAITLIDGVSSSKVLL